MKISEGERVAIIEVLAYGEAYGYGNLIAHLQTAWAARLMDDELTEKAARAATGGKGYPFALQRDLIDRGEWDETGVRYKRPAEATNATR
jgi:hypothetical protein